MVSVRRLLWDDWNVAHIARHSVTPQEVEEVCHGDPLVQESYAGRFILIGPTRAGRILSLVIDPEDEEGIYYLVTARQADRKERRLYTEEKGEASR